MGDDTTNILIVDDLPEKLLAYQTILEDLGQNLVTVRSGEEALKHLLRSDFAVILLDVQMPGMNGFETAHLIRSRKRSARTPIIFLTAFADEVQLSRGYATGAVDYIATPVVPEVLRAKVRVFVELFLMRQQVARQAEESARRAAAEEAARRSNFLAEASRALSNSLDFEATLGTLVRLALPGLADLSAVVLGEEHPGPPVCAWVAEGVLTEANGPRPAPWLEEHIACALREGEHALVQLPIPQLAIAAGGPDLAIGQALVLPLVARSKTLGTLALGRRAGAPTFSADEVSLAVEVAGRAAIALDNALLFRAIQENDHRKNEFLAMLSHELRNPLAPVRNALQVLGLIGIDHPRFRWAQGVIHRQVDHLVRLVDDLLDVSRITRGKIRLQVGPLAVADVVASAVETSRPLIEDHHHNLTVAMPEEPVFLQGDPARLAQVLSNLLNNAAKYTPDGGHIFLTVEHGEGEVAFRVRDDGAGIPRHMLTRVFDLFTQVDCTLDRSQGGLGIGLTLVKSLVELHGGSVSAISAGPGQGSEFTVRLPVLTGELQSRPRTANGEVGPARRILVVDDNMDAAESLALYLQLTGHEVLVTHDGPTALSAVGEFHPEVVLVDIGLPGMDGYEVGRRLRASPGYENVFLVALTGYGREEDRRRSREAGFHHHLVKPVPPADLRGLLATLTAPA
jgi:signal transduction histidine kinase/DNA-binding response OmpR family regulator